MFSPCYRWKHVHASRKHRIAPSVWRRHIWSLRNEACCSVMLFFPFDSRGRENNGDVIYQHSIDRTKKRKSGAGSYTSERRERIAMATSLLMYERTGKRVVLIIAGLCNCSAFDYLPVECVSERKRKLEWKQRRIYFGKRCFQTQKHRLVQLDIML